MWLNKPDSIKDYESPWTVLGVDVLEDLQDGRKRSLSLLLHRLKAIQQRWGPSFFTDMLHFATAVYNCHPMIRQTRLTFFEVFKDSGHTTYTTHSMCHHSSDVVVILINESKG